MPKYKIIFVLAVLIVLGIIVFTKKAPVKDTPVTDTPITKNIDVLKSEKNLPIIAEEVSYFEKAIGYYARPNDGATYPGIVMIHENRGLRPETKMAAEQLAKEGYIVLAVDLLGKAVETQDEARALTANFKEEKGVENMRKAVQFLRREGAVKVASLGWCFGGRQSLELATSGEKMDATVGYYGAGMPTTKEKLAPIKWPVLGIFGDKDQAIPVETVHEFEASLNTLGVRNEIHIYPGVGHAFANPSGMNYAPEATRDAWEKTLAFLDTSLKK